MQGKRGSWNRWSDQIQPREQGAVFWSSLWFFCLLVAYYIVRPLRETVSTTLDGSELASLFLATFYVMLVAVPLYAAAVAWLPRQRLVPLVFHFLAVNLLVFAAFLPNGDQPLAAWPARVLFVWVSVFGLFTTSVFWSVLADLFSSESGKRLFGFVAAGGTLGGMAGSLLVRELAEWGPGNLVLVAAVMLEAGILCSQQLEGAAGKLAAKPVAERPERPATAGIGVVTGIGPVLRSPYLLGIAVFLFLIYFCGTNVYFQQAEIVRAAYTEEAERTELFATLNLVVQPAAFALQALATGPLLRRWGLSTALSLLPAVYVMGFVWLGTAPTLATIVVLQTIGRSIGYGVTAPSREVLFTVVDRDVKYRSKSFLDTVVIRAGDVAAGVLYRTLRSDAWAWSSAATALAMLPITLLWLPLAWWLGRQQQRLNADR